MSPSLTSFFIVLCIVFVDSLDVCYSDVDIRSKYSNSTPDFQIFSATPDCIQQFDLRRSGLPEPDLCHPGLLSVDLSPLASTSTVYRPHVQLNISVLAHSDISHMFIRLECVHAPDGNDVYCHDEARMSVNGVWRWPCRGVAVGHDVDIPLSFGYSCFRLFALSQYLVNVTVFPHNCRTSFLITSPHEYHLFPSIADFYGDKNLSAFSWTPVLFVDLSEDDGVWFRVAYPKELSRSARVITVAVFQTEPESHYVEALDIAYPTTGVKWFNAGKGTYAAYAYLQRHDCTFPCRQKDTACVVCLHTSLNFTLHESKASWNWKALRSLRDSGVGAILLVGVACLLMIAVAFVIVGLRRHFYKPDIVVIPLDNIKKVHIIYSDECEEHADVILELTRLLEASRVVKVSLDQRDLLAAGDRPSNWLVNSLNAADVVLLVVSPCTEALINGRELNSKRPYPDMFKPSYDIFLADWAQSNNRARFALVTLPYSPATPYQLSVLNLSSFEVPAHLGEIVLFIRGDTPPKKRKRGAVLDVAPSLLEPLLTSIEAAKTAVEGRTEWPYLAMDAHEPPKMKLAEGERRVARTAEEQALLAEELGMEPPDKEEDEGKEEANSALFSSAVELLPMDSDSD